MKKNIIRYLISRLLNCDISIIIPVCSLIGFIYGLINIVSNELYKIGCERFYEIPGYYFSINIDEKLVFIFLIGVLLFYSIFPRFLKKQQKNILSKGINIECIVFSIMMGLIIGCVNFLSLNTILKQINFKLMIDIILNHAIACYLILFILGTFSIIGITFFKKIGKKKLVLVLWIAALVISLIIFVCGIMFKIFNSVEDKTKYEFVEFKNKDYVVLTEYNNMNLVVEYDLDKNHNYIFKTKRYFFIKKNKGICRYIDIENKPLINK